MGKYWVGPSSLVCLSSAEMGSPPQWVSLSLTLFPWSAYVTTPNLGLPVVFRGSTHRSDGGFGKTPINPTFYCSFRTSFERHLWNSSSSNERQ